MTSLSPDAVFRDIYRRNQWAVRFPFGRGRRGAADRAASSEAPRPLPASSDPDATRPPLRRLPRRSPADLLLCRDCLVHLSFADIRQALARQALAAVVHSRIPYLLTTTFPGCEANEDIVTGDWRPLDLERAPFGFPNPLEPLAERCTEGGGTFADKSLGLWRVADLNGLPFLAEPGDGGGMDQSSRDQLLTIAEEWDRAMVENDAEAIGRYLADDWTLIGSDGSVGDKGTFLDLVRSGVLSHDVMESHDVSVRVYGEAAVMIARGISGGTYQGRPFREVERVSCVFVRERGRWRCVSTHLSRLGSEGVVQQAGGNG